MALYDVLTLGSTGKLEEVQIDTATGVTGAVTMTATNLSGSTIAANTPVNIYYDTGSASLAMRLADITSGNSYYFHGFTTASVAASASGTVQLSGSLAGFSSLSQGVLYYLDPTTAGAITTTIPTNAQDWQAVGYSIDATHLMVLFQFVSARQTQAGLIRTTEDSLIAFTNLAGISTGGNARGSKAVDWQLQRAATNQVAGADYSVLAGGENNYIPSAADHSVAAGGKNNQSQKAFSAIGGGESNSIESGGDHAVIAGGKSNLAKGQYDAIGGGLSNNTAASQTHNAIAGGDTNSTTGYAGAIAGGFVNSTAGTASAVIGGGRNSATKDFSVVSGNDAKAYRYAERAHAPGGFYSDYPASAQSSEVVFWGETSGTTATELFLDNGSQRLIIDSDGRGFTYDLVAVAIDINDYSRINRWSGSGNVYRTASGNITLLNDSLTSLPIVSVGLWALTITADTTHQSLKATATGETGKTLHWTISVKIVEVT